MKNFTEIANIAGQRHNTKMFETDIDRQSGASRQADEQAAKKILCELEIYPDKLLEKIGEIESELYDDARDNETVLELIDRACADLRFMITNAIGE